MTPQPFPYVLRDDGFLSTYEKQRPLPPQPRNGWKVHLIDPFPSRWNLFAWILSRPRLIAYKLLEARGELVAVIEPESTARTRGWDPNNGLPN